MYCVEFGMSKKRYGVVTMIYNIVRLLARLISQVLVCHGLRWVSAWALDGDNSLSNSNENNQRAPPFIQGISCEYS